MIVLFLIGALSCLLISCRKQTLTADMVEEAVNREIPDGSTRTEVVKFLDTHTFGRYKFEHGEYRSDPETITKLQKYSSFDEPKKLGDRLGGYIGGAIYDVKPGFATTTYIEARFYFDKDGILIDHTVEEKVGK